MIKYFVSGIYKKKKRDFSDRAFGSYKKYWDCKSQSKEFRIFSGIRPFISQYQTDHILTEANTSGLIICRYYRRWTMLSYLIAWRLVTGRPRTTPFAVSSECQLAWHLEYHDTPSLSARNVVTRLRSRISLDQIPSSQILYRIDFSYLHLANFPTVIAICVSTYLQVLVQLGIPAEFLMAPRPMGFSCANRIGNFVLWKRKFTFISNICFRLFCSRKSF